MFLRTYFSNGAGFPAVYFPGETGGVINMISDERALVFETTQLGVESTAGVAVAALKRLLCTSFEFDPNIPVEPYTPQGSKAPTTATVGKEDTEGTFDGRLCFNDICYLLAGCLGAPEITTPGGATNRRKWLFKPNNWSPDSIQTYTVEKGSGVGGYAERVSHVVFPSLRVRFAENEASVNGTLLGKKIDYDAQMSTNEIQQLNIVGSTAGTFTLSFSGQTTPALAHTVTASQIQTVLEALSTIGAGNVVVTLLSTKVWSIEFRKRLSQQNVATLVGDFALLTGGSPAITTPTAGVAPTDIPEVVADVPKVSIWTGEDVAGLARLRRVHEIEWNIGDRFAKQWELDDEEPSWSGLAERGPAMSATVQMQRNADFRTLIPYLRAKTTRYWRIKLTGPIIEGADPYLFQVTFPEKSREPGHGSAMDVATGQFELFNVYDSVFGGFVEIEVHNTLTAL